MTPTTLAETILRDVPRFASPDGNLLAEEDVLAALTAALNGVDERAGEIVSELREVAAVFTKDTVFTDAADLITALLTANAVLRAERDEALEWLSASQGYIADAVFALDKQEKAEAKLAAMEAIATQWKARAEAAEAQNAALTARVEGLTGALERVAEEASVPVHTWKNGINFKKMYEGWRKIAVERIDVARAALTTEASHE